MSNTGANKHKRFFVPPLDPRYRNPQTQSEREVYVLEIVPAIDRIAAMRRQRERARWLKKGSAT